MRSSARGWRVFWTCLALPVALAACDGRTPEAATVAPSFDRGPGGGHDGKGLGIMGAPLNPVLVAKGKQIFRYDDFGDTTFWTGTLHMNDVVETLTPLQALGLGLKVDVDAVPPQVLAAVLSNPALLKDPATTRSLLQLGAVVGVNATVRGDRITSFGVTCALCHSTVDNSVTGGIGHRLDGWPNHDLAVGGIIASSPAIASGAFKDYLLSWPRGFYDARVNLDGRMDGPVVIPPAYGLHGVALATYTGDGTITYWNDYVAVTQMHGQGNFSDPRLGIHVRNEGPDLVQPKLTALREYQLSLAAPSAMGQFDPAAAGRGRTLFLGKAACATCHTGPEFTDAPRLHAPSEIPVEASWADRSGTKAYRTTPLRGLVQHAPYFHDGSATTLADVVDRYDAFMHLGLSAGEKSDLVQYLRSL